MINLKLSAFLTLLAGFLVSVTMFLGFYKAIPPANNILGATPGADRYNLDECTNGFCHRYNHAAMVTATSTPCAFQSPSATSSLANFTAQVSSSTSVTATTYTLATSTTRYATTSIISYFGTTATNQRFNGPTTTILSAAYGTLVYSAGASSSAETILPPNTWVVLGVQGGTGNFGTAAQVGGHCNAQINFTN